MDAVLKPNVIKKYIFPILDSRTLIVQDQTDQR